MALADPQTLRSGHAPTYAATYANARLATAKPTRAGAARALARPSENHRLFL